MVMFLDWITRSGLCTSLADLSISTNYSTPAPTPLNRLLETTGASLTRFDEDHYGLDPWPHGNLLHNTNLQTLDFRLYRITHDDKSQRRPSHAAWTEATRELHGVFSSIRSRRLEHIEVAVGIQVMHSTLEPAQPNDVLEKLDLRDLHDVMSQPYFDTLNEVGVEMTLGFGDGHTKSHEDSSGQKLEAMVYGILQPWSARGIVTVTWGHGYALM
ncbi:uncharacterized protein B0H18DRAFT_83133 [Fomitopsis serialis]|uniref:uncharacterized protein n=1 Tax=Fomitopsis serialis TaxID=139415 RepID=UPI00200787EE|nr:uncharacterized protein B0H18DRAFT_83133 [Neoantrodia serialis]KAH9931413.1 hypothetical protein B0H18DRAFT_83133 [Neoantrodia serialis]